MSPVACIACRAAERAPLAGHPVPGCMGCIARMLAGTGAHLEAKAAGRVTPSYLALLKALFGADWKWGASQVKVWAIKIDSNK